MGKKIIRVFPRKNSHIPDDNLAFIGYPPLVRPEAAEMHPDVYEAACILEDRIKNKWKYRLGFNDLFKQGRLF